MLENIREKTLDNGLKVLCLKKPSAPIASLQVWYKTGSVNETDGIRGISHILEHMLFRGSLNVQPEEHARKINEVGGHSNAFTSEDVTACLDSVPSTHLEMVLALEADRMRNLRIEPAIFETERKVIAEEYHTYMNNPVAKAFLEFRTAFYGTHPYAVSPLGTLEDINRITVDDCMAYYRRWYRPSNAVAIAVGDIGNEDAFFDRMEHHFGTIPGDSSSVSTAPAAEVSQQNMGTRQFMKRVVDFDVPVLLLGYPAPPSSHPDAVALEILQMIVAQGETGRFHREIVRRQSLAVMTGGMNHFMRRSGMSMFFSAFTPDVGHVQIRKAMDEQISLIKSVGITDRDMEKVRNITLSHRIFELYSSEHLCQRIGYAETIDGDYRLWAQRIKTLEHLDAATVTAVAQRYWSDERRTVLYLKPKRINPLLLMAGLGRRTVRTIIPRSKKGRVA